VPRRLDKASDYRDGGLLLIDLRLIVIDELVFNKLLPIIRSLVSIFKSLLG